MWLLIVSELTFSLWECARLQISSSVSLKKTTTLKEIAFIKDLVDTKNISYSLIYAGASLPHTFLWVARLPIAVHPTLFSVHENNFTCQLIVICRCQILVGFVCEREKLIIIIYFREPSKMISKKKFIVPKIRRHSNEITISCFFYEKVTL